MAWAKIKTSAGGAWIFFALTYAASWCAFGFAIASGHTLVALIGIWSPTLIALALTLAFHGPSGVWRMLKRFGRVQVGLQWWAALLFLPLAIHWTGRTFWQFASGGPVDMSLLDFQWWLQPILTSILIAGLGEELGWRGFALPRLQASFGALTATFILAAAHICWHLPTYWLGQGIHNVPALYVVGFAIPWTVIFVWIYNRSGGSLLFAVGFHAVSNASLSIARFMPLDREVPIEPSLLTRLSLPVELAGPYLSVVAVYWIIALIVIAAGGLKPANTDTP